MLSEKEKMIQGLPYNAMDKQLVKERDYSALVLSKFNQTVFSEQNREHELLKDFIHTKGNFIIKPPFTCDYGYNISVGDNLFCNYNCTILDTTHVEIKDNVLIGPNVQIYTACHPTNPQERLHGIEYGKPISIGNNVWIGGGCIICPGVTIGDNSVIGAGSVVTKSIPQGVIAVGNPCKVIKNVND